MSVTSVDASVAETDDDGTKVMFGGVVHSSSSLLYPGHPNLRPHSFFWTDEYKTMYHPECEKVDTRMLTLTVVLLVGRQPLWQHRPPILRTVLR